MLDFKRLHHIVFFLWERKLFHGTHDSLFIQTLKPRIQIFYFSRLSTRAIQDIEEVKRKVGENIHKIIFFHKNTNKYQENISTTRNTYKY